MESTLIWIGIAVCILHSAIFSGCNLAFFSLGRMRLEAEAERDNDSAKKVLKLRKDANLLLCTILWGNVSVNVLLALLSESVLTGIGGFLFSTIGITIFGEIMPQAYFSRNALRVASLLSPLITLYQFILYPITKPCAILLDGWIGPEGPTYMRERDLEIILEKHIDEEDSEISANEGQGALNFLELDDRLISEEGNEIAEETIYQFPSKLDLPILPELHTEEGQAFLASLKKNHSRKAVILDEFGTPFIVLDTTSFLSSLCAEGDGVDIYKHCHRPVIVDADDTHLDSVLGQFVVEADDSRDLVVDRDVVIFWTAETKRIVTGADIFGRLLKGIAKREPAQS
ncbi:MAG: DUF21 domain-containing protein [Akkermansiaceae bacterium]